MTEFNEKIVKELSRLAQIELPDEEIGALLNSLKQVLSYFDELMEVDISDLATYSHVEEQGVGSMREDVVEDVLDRKLLLANAPDHIGGMVRTPSILSGAT